MIVEVLDVVGVSGAIASAIELAAILVLGKLFYDITNQKK